MINLHNVAKENIKKHNPNQPQISAHSYRMLIVGGSASRKTNSLFNLISQKPDIEKKNYMLMSICGNISISN